MYFKITTQKTGGMYNRSCASMVKYLEKEERSPDQMQHEYFFNQYQDSISPEEVVREIDANTATLKRIEPRFYTIIVCPSQSELKHLHDRSTDLRHYTREIMKDYVTSFNRELQGRPVQLSDIKYYAKIEHQRYYKGMDHEVKENQPYATKIVHLRSEISRIETGKQKGSIEYLKEQIALLEKQAPHKQHGERIVPGMQKAGAQSHIHIIMSRKDASNTYSLSPGSKYKASQVVLNGKLIKRGFARNEFYFKAEKTFDRMFGYQREFSESYGSMKDFVHQPKRYFSSMLNLPIHERSQALKSFRETVKLPDSLPVPAFKAKLLLQMFTRLQKSMDRSVRSSSLEI